MACPIILLLLAFLSLSGPSWAEEVGHLRASPYAGEQTRAIVSLSDDDLTELATGGGWGLVRPAELNGVPGPAHLLELADEIGLDADQLAAIETIRDEMRAGAITAGDRFVAAERALDAAFKDSVPDVDALSRLVAEAESTRANLRLVHLSAHLRTTPLLTRKQVARYAVLRGYADDPCESVPEGHNRTMWLQHNGCG